MIDLGTGLLAIFHGSDILKIHAVLKDLCYWKGI